MKALSPIAVLISALLLQGCVAAAVVGTAAVGTKAATDPRSVGTQVDDGTLEVRVNSALSKDEQIKTTNHLTKTPEAHDNDLGFIIVDPRFFVFFFRSVKLAG